MTWRTPACLHFHNGSACARATRPQKFFACKCGSRKAAGSAETRFAIFKWSARRKLHLWSILSPSLFDLNNKPISYRQTIAQFTLCHLAARTPLPRNPGRFLHTLEYGRSPCRGGMKSSGGVIPGEQRVSFISILSTTLRVVFLSFQRILICICFRRKAEKKNKTDKSCWVFFFFKRVKSILPEMCCLLKTSYCHSFHIHVSLLMRCVHVIQIRREFAKPGIIDIWRWGASRGAYMLFYRWLILIHSRCFQSV